MEELTTIFSDSDIEQDNSDFAVSADSAQDGEQILTGQDTGQEDFSSSPSSDTALSSESGKTGNPAAETDNTAGLTEQEKNELKEEIENELGSNTNTDAEVQEEESTIHTIDDIYTLLSEYMEKQETYIQETKEYNEFYTEQSCNILSALSVLVVVLAFATGVLLARIVWRKM